ncbi:MAG TPA: dihydrofolate reductase [Crenotrichaceae bacterium]|nr:dihydrofolate reductase [Crenotrichaceae bacterium]
MGNISIIVAMSTNRVIGINNQLPWHISADLKHFKKITLGKPIVMGRNTWLSLGRPLPGRENIVLSRNPAFDTAGCTIAHSLEDVFNNHQLTPEIMFIGGSDVYQKVLPFAHKLYLTKIHRDYHGDVWFPELDGSWVETGREDHPAKESVPAFSFLEFKREKTA